MEKNCLFACEVCGAQSLELRRGRCWGCYQRWAELRPVGAGAFCIICTERRRESLRLTELFGQWQVLCHNCAARAMRISPMPKSLESIRERLERDRRVRERRAGKRDYRILPHERRASERRIPERDALEWLDEDLLVEIIEPIDGVPEPLDQTRIFQVPEARPAANEVAEPPGDASASRNGIA